MGDLGAMMDLVLDDVPEPASQGPLHGNVGDIDDRIQLDLVELVQALEGPFALHCEAELDTFTGAIWIWRIKFPDSIEQAGDVVVLDLSDVHELLAEGSLALMRTPLKLVFRNKFQRLQSDSPKTLVMLAKDTDFVCGNSDRCAGHRGLAGVSVLENSVRSQ